MSAGSKIVPVRIPAELLKAVETDLQSCNAHLPDYPYTVSDWIRKAIAERLAKHARSRSARRPASNDTVI